MISLVLPLIFLCLDSVKKSLLSIIFCPFIVLDICFWYCFQTVFEFIDDLLLKPFIDEPPKKIESDNPEEIRSGNDFIDKLMRNWQTRSTEINEHFQFDFRILHFEFGICSCLATVAPSFMRDGNALLKQKKGRTRVEARLKDGDLVLEGPILVNFLNFKKTLDTYVRIHCITAYVEFDFDSKTLKNGNLIDVNIEDIKFYFVNFKEESLLHYVMSIAASRLVSIASFITTGIVQILVKKYLPLKLEQFKFFDESADASTSATANSSSDGDVLENSEPSQTDHDFISSKTPENSPE